MTRETKPLIPCICCNQIMEAKYQAPLVPGGRCLWHITCENRACEMFSFTLADLNYPPQDLDAYLESGRKRLAAEAVKS